MGINYVKNGEKRPNTIEINPAMAEAYSFSVAAIHEAGFILTSLKVSAEVSVSSTSLPRIVIDDNYSGSNTLRSREQINFPAITSDIERRLKKIVSMLNGNTTLSVTSFVLERSGVVYRFMVKGNKKGERRAILHSRNKIRHYNVDNEVLMRELASLFYGTCFFDFGSYKLPTMCKIQSNY